MKRITARDTNHSGSFARIATVLLTLTTATAAIADTTFTYQGELKANGNLTSGTFNMDFSLWNAASAGNQVGSTLVMNGVQVVNGRFTVELDFGADTFNNSNRWLEIAVDGFTLSPRNQITRSPYSVQTRGIFVTQQNLVGIGTTAPNTDSRLTVHANGQLQAIHASSGAASWPTIYGFNGNTLGHVLHADGIADVKLDQGGVVIVGQIDGENVAIDGNEIMARNNGSESTLHLNLEGGPIVTGGRLGVGMNPGFAQLSVEDSDPTAAFGLAVETSNQSALPSIYAENLAGGPVLWALGSSDASLGDGGLIVAGDEQGVNLAIDNNEIMARNNGQPAPLHLNLEGGPIFMGEHAIKPPFAYGKILKDGTLVSGSNNITSVSVVPVANDGTNFLVGFSTPYLETDITVCTDASAFNGTVWVQTSRDGTQMRIRCISDVSGEETEDVSFVVFRP